MMTSGIYIIRNTITGTEYIGSSNNIERRWKEHRQTLRRGKHRNPYLQRSWNKYSEDVFTFEILEETIDLNDQELYQIYQHQPVLNCKIVIIRKNPDELGFILREETRNRISKTNSGKPHPNKGHVQSEESRQKLSIAHRGKTLSPNHRQAISESLLKISQKLSDAHKGQSAWNKGKYLSEETKQKQSIAHKGKIPWNKGRICSIEECQKNSDAHKGLPVSDETRQKLSDAHRGRIGGMKGKHHSEETRQKISDANKGKSPWNKGKMIPSPSSETRRKISKALKGKPQPWVSSTFKGKPKSLEHRKKLSEVLIKYWQKRREIASAT